MDARGFSTIPADSFWWTTTENKQDKEEAAFINAQVQVQYYKDALGFGATHQTTNVASLHEAFEQDLCDRLRKSGFANFASAKDCSFSFVEHSGLNRQGPVETAYANQAITEAQLSLLGLANQLSLSDRDLVNQIVTESHRQAFCHVGSGHDVL